MSQHGLFSLHPSFRDASDEDSPPRSRVKRALFGPTDHDENLKFVKKELEESNKTTSNRWNFNFKEGTPCEGRFQWEEHKQQEEAAEPPEEQKENCNSDMEKDLLPMGEGGSSADLHTPLQRTSEAGGSSADLHMPNLPIEGTSSAAGSSADLDTTILGTSVAVGGSSVDLKTPLHGTSSADLQTALLGTSSVEAEGRSDEAPTQPRTKDQKLVTDFLPARKSRTKKGKIKVQKARVTKRDVSPVFSSSD